MTNKELLAVIKKAERERVTKLDLSEKGISILPPEIGRLTALTELDLRDNQLTELPTEIGRLTALRMRHGISSRYGGADFQVCPGSGRFGSLPHNRNREIIECLILTDLDLSSNQLTALPPDIGRLIALTHLKLLFNHLTALPHGENSHEKKWPHLR